MDFFDPAGRTALFEDGYFGMIGSTTKRANFERRLLTRGVSPETLTSLICPMGITGIHSKEPNLIAIAITAQLLQYL